jgi:hypothetical protein
MISRRKFIAIGSTAAVGSVILYKGAPPLYKSLTAPYFELTELSFTAEIFRAMDMLNLRFFFYNASKSNGRLTPADGKNSLFVYVQLPAQHIAEALVTTPKQSRDDFQRVASFVSRPSYIALRMIKPAIDYNVANLLNWTDNFALVTLDDFAKQNGLTFGGYDKLLAILKDDFEDGKLSTGVSWHQNFLHDQKVFWPLTKLEVPYKMMLSPVAPPASGENDVNRQVGFHTFDGNNDLVEEYKNSTIRIVRPWETELVYKNFLGQITAPRLKVVSWRCQHADDKDQGPTELLPAPINREELYHLTMNAEGKRDVVSERMRISSLGVTANLKYKHEDPLAFTLVAWQQQIKNARDNYVSVTFRAIDTFTGIKLLISIVAERRYEHKVSFLPKLYHVAYAENEKVYDSPLVVSKIPFLKVRPLTEGKFFEPVAVPGTGDAAFLVSAQKPAPGSEIGCEMLLTFDYIGVDKNGKEHAFQSKILFIPAEQYEITYGQYVYQTENGPEPPRGSKSVVPIDRIGQLNPQWREGNERNPPCGTPGPAPYRYKIVKNFSKDSKDKLAKTLSVLSAYVAKNRPCYKIDLNTEVTYSRIENLKKASSRLNGKSSDTGVVRHDASNATYETSDILLFCTVNDKLFDTPPQPSPTDPKLEDGFLNPNPLIAQLQDANVLISQLNQMEGQNVYRTVSYSDSYLAGNCEIDNANAANQAKLLFKLHKPLDNFFSANYRNAGAMVNPGLSISHISVLEQTVAYNESHNTINKFANGDNRMIPTSSIFRGLDAEILGIPLKSIVNEFLPVEDLPVFNYLKQVEDTLAQLTQVPAQYIERIKLWTDEYNNAKQQLENLRRQFDELLATFNLKENTVRGWIEKIIQSTISMDYFDDLSSTLTQGKAQYKSYADDVLKKINEQVKKKYTFDIEAEMKAIEQAGHIRLNELFKKAHDAAKRELETNARPLAKKLFSEAYRYYFIAEFAKGRMNDISSRLRWRIEHREDVEEIYLEYYNSFVEAYNEAKLYTLQFVQEQQAALIQYLEEVKEYVEEYVKAILDEYFGDFFSKYYNWILLAHQLSDLYAHYYKIFRDLKKAHYQDLAQELGITIPAKPFDDIEQLLAAKLRKSIEGIDINSPKMDEELRGSLRRLKAMIIDILDNEKFRFSNYEETYKKQIEELVQQELSEYITLINRIDDQYQKYRKQYEDIRNAIANLDVFVKGFIQSKIKELKDDIEEQKKELMRHLVNSTGYQKAQRLIMSIERMISMLRGVHNQKLEYDYSTNKFKNATIGVIQFTPKNTSLTVHVEYGAELAVDAFSGSARIARQYFKTSSTLTDFKLGLLGLLHVDFEKVEFVSGSEVKDDFKVLIRDVQFAGCLSFVQAFQEYLSTLNDNLVFNIDSKGASIGYGFTIPDFSAGYFNFFNLSLTGLLTLPFDPKQALQMNFGIGSPLNKFGLTVSGIFGGQGFFNVIAEPKRGIVGLELCLEFGAIFHLNLSVARGNAYLVGGIYIKRLNGVYQIKAYILCVGRFNVLSLFSASITFYMGLEGNSHVLVGRCSVKVTKHFTRWYSVSVWCAMEKTIQGARSRSDQQHRLVTNGDDFLDPLITIEDSNLDKNIYYGDEILYMTIATPPKVPLTAQVVESGKNAMNVKTTRWNDRDEKNSLVFLEFKFDKARIADYELLVKQGDKLVLKKKFSIVNRSPESCTKPGAVPPAAQAYFGSYYL